jgi:hypothetical protein
LLLEIDRAAEALGVPKERLLSRLDRGVHPEAVKRGGAWAVPADALASIAEREGWKLDLTEHDLPVRGGRFPEQLNHHHLSETAAAHAAVVLAETQASAARAEVGDLEERLAKLSTELAGEQAVNERTTAELADAEKQLAVVERDKAVAEARADELREQLQQERAERNLLTARIGTLEADRETAIGAMGWWARRCYHRSRAATAPATYPVAANQGQK